MIKAQEVVDEEMVYQVLTLPALHPGSVITQIMGDFENIKSQDKPV